MSPHVLTNIERVLVTLKSEGGFEWEPQIVEEYLDVLIEMAEASGGGIVEPSEAATDCDDYKDNRILELALASQAVLILSNDGDLLHMNPWRGTAILAPRDFVSRVDAVRRARRR